MNTTDLTYRAVDGLFTQFLPNTPAGEDAWRQIAKHTEGTGKVFHQHVASTVKQLRDAGYTVSKARKEKTTIDDILNELGV